MPYEDENLQPINAEPVAQPVVQPWESAIKDVQLSFSQQLGQLQQTLSDTLARFNPIANQQASAPTIEEVTDAELEDVVARGQGGAKIRKMVHAEMAKLKKAYIDPLEQVGLTSIANLTQEVAKQSMPYYEKYKKDIESKLQTIEPAARLNPAALKFVYNAVVGEHAAEIVSEAAEAAIRKTKQPAQDSGSVAGRVAGANAGQDDSFVAVFGQDADATLQEIGRTPDSQYIRMGYPGGYKEFAEKNKEFLVNKAYKVTQEAMSYGKRSHDTK